MDDTGAPRDPEEAQAAGAPAESEIDPRTTVGAVHLTVRDLDRSVEYYRETIGLSLLDRGGNRAVLGVESADGSRELVGLHENPDATPGRGYSGLYHLALLLPERRDLAAWLAHAARERVPMTGLSDHFVSEAVYLQDPDDHGIEIYWDRPRESWEGKVSERMTTLPLDVEDLMRELPDLPHEPFAGLPSGTRMGHIHLRVADLSETLAFYRDVLGFGLMAEIGGHAAFFSAGGYHHHIGANTWESAGVGAAPAGAATLRHATILVPDQAARDALLARAADSGQEPADSGAGPTISDPSGNRLLLAPA